MTPQRELTVKNALSEEQDELHQLRAVFNTVSDAIVVFDHAFQVINVNDAASQLFEKSRQELLQYQLKDFLMLFPYDMIEEYYPSFVNDRKFKYEGKMTLRSGVVKYVEFTCEKHVEASEIMVCTFRDITTHKIMENERFLSQHMFMDVFNEAVDGIVIFDQNGQLIDVNPSFCERLNYTREELLSKTLIALVEPAYHYKVKKLWRLLHQEGKASGEIPVKLENGDVTFFEFTTTANIYSQYYMSIMRDVTEKRMMEQQLLRSEKNFRAIFEDAIEAILIWRHDGVIVNANPASSRTFELPLDQLIGSNLFSFINHNHSQVWAVYNEFLEKEEIREQLPFYMPNGEEKELEFTGKKGIIEGYNLTIFRNISERTKMEQELRNNEQKFRKIFNGSIDGLILWDGKQKIIDVNSSACEILELTKEQICEKTMEMFITSNNFELVIEHKADLEKQGEGNGEIHYETLSGKVKQIEFSTKKGILPGLYMTIIRDVTEKKQMEEQIRKSDTLQVVGQLAAGIAHEIRNPMTALKGFIQLLQGSIKEDYSLYFEIITSELKRIETIITEFLVLAKPQAVKFEKRNLEHIVKETIDLLSAQAMLDNVQFITEFESQLPMIYCEPNQLKQVLINMMKNAIEVMKNGGVISVQLKRKDAKFIMISIQDEGEGISEERIRKLGEPFYTTKEKGTGLGLMVSYKIIEEHKGYIEVESELGSGTTFYIMLPV
ncbi:PAS domain S-box protein [Priestia megaterium]|nr:PAS domain S-box protein [Priestia megaterium]